jgi:class 3 adenylate cyclase
MSAIRRLAAILAADVAGYSRLMGVDEEGARTPQSAASFSTRRSPSTAAVGAGVPRRVPGRVKDLALFG